MPPHTGRYGLPEASWVPLAARVLCSANTPAPAYPGSARGACGGASVAAGLVQAQGHRRQHQLICQDATVWRSCLSTKPLSQFSRIRAPGSAYRARAQVMAQGGVPSSTGSTTAPIYAPPPCHRPPAHSSKPLREASKGNSDLSFPWSDAGKSSGGKESTVVFPCSNTWFFSSRKTLRKQTTLEPEFAQESESALRSAQSPAVPAGNCMQSAVN